MSIAEELFAEINRCLNAGDYDAIYERMHSEHRQYVNGALVAEGNVATRAADDVFYAMVPGVQRETHDLFGTDDRAVCRSTFRGATIDGRAIELSCLSMIYVRESLIVESWVYLDFSSLLLT